MKNIRNPKNKAAFKKCLLIILLAPVLFMGKIKASDYYWVGGTGNWSDFANHWATTSGGTTFHVSIPSPADDVFFDQNSFSIANQTVTLDVSIAFCKNFNWQNTLAGCRMANQNFTNKLSIFGSIDIASSNHFIFAYGIISLESPNTSSINISDTAYFERLEINNPNGSWNLIQPLFYTGKIYLVSGTFNTNNFPIHCGSFISNYGTSGRILNSGTSLFVVTNFYLNPTSIDSFAFKIDDSLVLNSINKDISFKDAVPYLNSNFTPFFFETGNKQFRNVYLSSDSVNGVVNGFQFYAYTKDSLIHNIYSYSEGFIHINPLLNNNLIIDSIIMSGAQNTGGINLYGDTLWLNHLECNGFGINSNYSIIKKIVAVTNQSGINSGINSQGICDDAFINGNFICGLSAKNLYIKKCVILQDGTFDSEIYFDTLMINRGYNYIIQAGDTITVNDQFILNGTVGNFLPLQSSIMGSQANIQFPQGNICTDYLILRDINAIGSNISAGANSIDLGNNTGWLFSACTPQLSNVWPGDANYDLTANNFDVLNIGLAYGETGPVRAGASNAWVAQPATDWSSFFLSAVNKKHADCDGNGVVDNNDTTAVSLNYGLTHPARFANQNSNQSTTSPPLYLIANPDTVIEGDTIEVDIFLGTQAVPVDSIYGIAFTMNFDTALVDTTYMPFDFTGCWLGTPGVDLLSYTHSLFLQGQVDVALTRTDHLNQSGYGFVGKAGVVIVDNIGARLTNTPPFVTLPLSISNVRALTVSEFYLTVSTNGDNVEIDTLGTTGFIHTDNLNEIISIYPNPVKDVLTINSGTAKINSIEVYNSLGQVILNEITSTSKINLHTQNFEQGIYLLKIITDSGIINRKFSSVKK